MEVTQTHKHTIEKSYLKSVLIHRIEKEESERARELGKAPRLGVLGERAPSERWHLSSLRKRRRKTHAEFLAAGDEDNKGPS